MAERSGFRTQTDDPDVPVIGVFGGLSSATNSVSSNVTNSQKLINAFVNKRNNIVRRKGSSIVNSLQSVTNTDAPLVSTHFFTFDNRKYAVVRRGKDLLLYALDEALNVVDTKTRLNIFTAASSPESVNFSVVIENNNCFVIAANKKSVPVVLTIVKRDVFIQSQASPTSFVLSVANYPAANVLSQSKVFLYTSSNQCVPVNTLTQTLFTLNVTSTVPFENDSNVGIKIHMVFACQGVSAAYYPGLYLYNTAVRKNIVPADVNVKVPDELASNPIINEPAIQNLDINTLEAYKTNNGTATPYTRVFNKQPTNVDHYEHSDGSYSVGSSLLTVRTPSFISFGALQSPTTDTRVFMFRKRTTATILPSYTVERSRFRLYVDKVLTPVNTYDSAGNNMPDDSGNSFYYSLGTTTSPGISLSSVVEIMYRSTAVLDNPLVDLTENSISIVIDDNYLFPLYGLSAIGDVGANVYPSIVQTVGNRVVLSGINNRLLVSNSDWNYRGISWNNFQVSTINFSETSAYLLTLTQNTSVIKGVLSVNGVIVVATDSGIYRVSGSNATLPPNATIANVSRVSNEVVSGQSALAIYSSRVYYVSKNGLYSLEYNKDSEELNPVPLSVEVSDYFSTYTATNISYSEFYRAFVISFAETTEMLVYFLESETFAVFRLTTPASVRTLPTLDGYQLTLDTNTSAKHVLFCRWDNTTADLSNVSAVPAGAVLTGATQLFTEVPQPLSFVTPAELIDTLTPFLRQSYGVNNVRAIQGNLTLTENTLTVAGLPIISALVTKAFTQSKLIGGNRVRAVSLMLSGSGAAKVKVVFQSAGYNDRAIDITNVALNTTEGYQGESLLNYQYQEKTSVGDNTNVRLRFNGIAEAYELALVFDGTIAIVGYQVDSAFKTRKRLR
jgi:hypothetical protein